MKILLKHLWKLFGWNPGELPPAKALPPVPPAHDVPFDEVAGRVRKLQSAPEAHMEPTQIRFESLVLGYSLGKLTPDEERELFEMTANSGRGTNLAQRKPERIGMRSSLTP